MSNIKVIKKEIPVKFLMLPDGDFEEPTIFSNFTLSVDYTKTVEPAGEAFELILTKKLNPNEPEILLDDMENFILEEDKEEYEWEVEYRNSKNFSSGFKSLGEDNYYSMMGLENEFINATPEDIRKAYKKVCLMHHPDKKETETDLEKEEANKTWLKYKDAFETLTDPDKKAKYDSTFKFDDKIPSPADLKKLKQDKDFFRLFGPIFLKNSIWSTRKPVPKIGDMNTDLKKVKRFYKFWYAFQSWRDFEVEGEHDVNEAENRWEKRQMQKENKKLKATMLKDEKARLSKLVDLAYKNDPRILAEENAIKEEKEKLRLERQNQALKLKQDKEDNERRLKEEYLEKKRQEVEERDQLKKNLNEKLFNLIKNDLGLELSHDDMLAIQINANIDNMQIIINETDKCTDNESKLNKYRELGSKFLGLKFKDDRKESSIWTKDEVITLQKAVKKFPAGTVNRWEKILEVVKTKSTNQIIKMTHYIATNPSLKFTSDTVDLRVLLGGKKESTKEVVEDIKEAKENKETKEEKTEDDENKDWSDSQQKALENALKKYPNSIAANERWTKIASEVEGKNKKQCVDRFKYLSQKIKNK